MTITALPAISSSAVFSASPSGVVIAAPAVSSSAVFGAALATDPAAYGGQDGIQWTLWEQGGTTFIRNLVGVDGTGLVEHNTAGQGTLHVADLQGFSPASGLDYYNVVKAAFRGTPFHAYRLTGYRTELRERVVSSDRTGPGLLSMLQHAVVYPERALKRTSDDNRWFNYGSATGDWYDSSQWSNPRAKRYPNSFRYPKPYGWPHSTSAWIWSNPGPEVRSVDGPNWFRASMTTTGTNRVKFWAAGDDTLELLLDGEVILRQHAGRWRRGHTVTVEQVSSGSHVVAAKVRNTTRSTNQKSGLLLYAAIVNDNDKPTSDLLRSDHADWLVCSDHANPPGWYGGQVLLQLVQEAQARGVAELTGLTFGFTSTTDSAGLPWSTRFDGSIPIGTRLSDVASSLIAHGLDIAVDPDGVLQCWESRGYDLTGSVYLSTAEHSIAEGAAGAVRTHDIVRTRDGWLSYTDSTGDATYGRREAMLRAGGAGGDNQAKRTSTAYFHEYSYPTETWTVTTTSREGPQPFIDYGLYDRVLVPSPASPGTPTPCRVLSVSYRLEEGVVMWEHKVYPDG